jgi:hypothetical protein
MQADEFALCKHCGAQAAFSTTISQLGSEPGHHIYKCATCNRSTWIRGTCNSSNSHRRDRPPQLAALLFGSVVF